jgi:hypothetical protein
VRKGVQRTVCPLQVDVVMETSEEIEARESFQASGVMV